MQVSWADGVDREDMEGFGIVGGWMGSGWHDQDPTKILEPNPFPGQLRTDPGYLDLHCRLGWCRSEIVPA